jgi:hypothetical protein
MTSFEAVFYVDTDSHFNDDDTRSNTMTSSNTMTWIMNEYSWAVDGGHTTYWRIGMM